MVFWLLVASLYTALHNIENNICVNCRAHFEKYAPVGLATSWTAGTITISPSSFKGNHIAPSRPTDSVSSDITRRSKVSQPGDAKLAPDFIQSVVSPISVKLSPSVAQQPVSLPETSNSPKGILNQLGRWSVNFNSDDKPVLNVKLEYVLTFGAKVRRVRFSPDGKYLAVGVKDGRAYIYDVKTGVKSWSVAFILVWRW